MKDDVHVQSMDGMVVKRKCVKADGACLFNSVAIGLEGVGNKSEELR